MNDNKELLSDEELIASKKLLSNEEVQQILDKEFTVIISPTEEIKATTVEIEKALNNTDLEKILFNKNISKERQEELVSEQISIYVALRLGLPIESVSSIENHKTLQEAFNKAMNNYLETYVDYETFFGIFRIQRKDIVLLRKCYMSIILVMIYITFYNLFPGICVGSTIMSIIGTLIDIILLINTIRISLKIWSLALNEENN